MPGHHLSMQIARMETDKWSCFNVFCKKKYVASLTQQIIRKVNVLNVFTQYMSVGSWVKLGNILLYEKKLGISIGLFPIVQFARLDGAQAYLPDRSDQISLDKFMLHS